MVLLCLSIYQLNAISEPPMSTGKVNKVFKNVTLTIILALFGTYDFLWLLKSPCWEDFKVNIYGTKCMISILIVLNVAAIANIHCE